MIAHFISATVLLSGGQRYGVAAAAIEPVELQASCAPAASLEVNQGAAWLLVLAPREARRAFERAADADPDCALAYWGQAASYLPVDDELPPAAAVAAGAAVLVRARATGGRAAHERALVEALAPVFLPADVVAGRPAALPARFRQYRDRLCAVRDQGPRPALDLLCARASWLGSTLPGDAASVEATRLVAASVGERPLAPGAAVLVLQADAAPPALAAAAVEAVLRSTTPAVAPFHLACRALVRRGDWVRAAAAGEAALARAGSPAAAALLLGRREATVAEWLLEAYVQQGRAADAHRLMTAVSAALGVAAVGTEPDQAEVIAAHRLSFARQWTRWLVALRDQGAMDPVPDAVRMTGPAWLFDFTRGLRAALAAWPGPRPAPFAEAAAARAALEPAARPEVELARVLIDAALSASQDEHHTLELQLAHAVDLEQRVRRARRDAWPWLPVRELAAELWLRAFREPDALREARAALDEHPNRARPWRVVARASARMQRDADAAAAYTTLLAIKASADPGDPDVTEARAFLARRPGASGDRRR